MIITGKNAVYEALKSNLTINKLCVQNNLSDKQSNDIIAFAKQSKIKINFCGVEVLDRMSKNQKHQGFVMETVEFSYSSLQDVLDVADKKQKSNFIVILDGIEDPHNLGAIIRTCECAGVDGIIIGEHRCCQVTDTVIKTSVGAVFSINIARVTNINQTIEKLKQNNIWVYGLELGGEEIGKVDFSGNVALVVGSEGFGISKQTQKNCDNIVSLAQNGSVNSLNASVACGIAVYHILQNR